jgi:uncharacterized phage protein gp47/JayE
MTFGLTADGFVRKRLADTKADYVAAFTSVFGPVDTSDDSVFGLIIGIFAERHAALWELAEGIYLALYPASAEGVQLDGVAALTGLTRIAADESTAVIAATGTQGTVIPLGKQVSVAGTGEVFNTDVAQTIDKADAVRVDISVDTAVVADTYRVTIDSVDHDFVAPGGATIISIAAGLVAAISGGSSGMTPTDNLDGTFYITSTDGETGHDVDVSVIGTGTMSITNRASPIPVTAVNAGAVLVLAETLTTIVTPVAGWDSVTNIKAGIEGRDIETDAELRIRIEGARLGAGTVEAIKSRIQDEVDGVTRAIVIENRTDDVVDGQPAHSIHVIVQGGADQDIADKIWEVKPAGIATYGSETETVEDSEGNSQTIYFSRPTSKYGWVKVVYTLTPEETFPAGGIAAIKQSLLDFGNTFEIGQDMYLQRWYGPVFDATTGIASAVITHDTTPTAGGPPTYVGTDEPIAVDELAVFDLARMDVSEAP